MKPITSELLVEKFNEAVVGTFEPLSDGKWYANIPADTCTVLVGWVRTPDGRSAEVHITVTTDEDDFISPTDER